MDKEKDDQNRYEIFPLSDIQESYLVGKQLDPSNEKTGCHIYYEITEKDLNIEALNKAWNKLINHHDMLRDKVFKKGKQQIQKEAGIYEFKVYDESQFEEVRERLSHKLYSAEDYPLYEIAVTKKADNEYVIHVSMDEWIVDASSISLLFRQWFKLYNDEKYELEPISLTYRNHIMEKNNIKKSKKYNRDLNYWMNKLSVIDGKALSILSKEAKVTNKRKRYEYKLSKEKWGKLKDKAIEKGCSPTSLLLAIFLIICNNEIQNKSYPIILTCSDRFSLNKEIDKVVGPFISTMIYLEDKDESYKDFYEKVKKVQENLWEGNDHQTVSGIRVLRELRKEKIVGSDYIIPIVFTSILTSVKEDVSEESWFNKVSYNISQTPQVYLDFQASEVKNCLHFNWDVLEGYFEDGVIEKMFENYTKALEELAKDKNENWALTSLQSTYVFMQKLNKEIDKERFFYQEFIVKNDSSKRIFNKWNELINEIEPLQAVFDKKGKGQIITKKVCQAEIINLKEKNEKDQKNFLNKLRKDMTSRSISLYEQPRYEVKIIELEEDTLQVNMIFDSTIADGQSLAVLYKRLLDKNETGLKESITFKDYLNNIAKENNTYEKMVYWKEKVNKICDGPFTSYINKVSSNESKRINKNVEFINELKEYAKRLNVRIESILAAVFIEVIYRREKKEFTITNISWDRPLTNPSIENTIGDFTQISWLNYENNNIDLGKRILNIDKEFENDVKNQSLEALKQFSKLKNKPKLPVVFTAPVKREELYLSNNVKEGYGLSKTPNVYLDFVCYVSKKSFVINWDYNVSAFNESFIKEMFEEYFKILENLISKKEILNDRWDKKSIHEYVERQAEINPSRYAVKCNEEEITYKELNERANKLAHYLINYFNIKDNMICICLDKSVEMIVTILAVLKAGGIYVPIDPSYPSERIKYIISDCKAKIIIVSEKSHSIFNKKDLKLVNINRITVENESKENLKLKFNGEESAYVIYTSGSTGRPKGVLIPHYNVVRLFKETEKWYGFNEKDVWTMFHSFAFDFSVWEIWGALLFGGKLIVIPYEVSRSFRNVYELLEKEKVTVFNQTPTAFNQILNVEDEEGVRNLNLRYIIFGGEALNLRSLKNWFEHHREEKTQLVNMYGITETTVHVTYRRINEEDTNLEESLIGEPISDLKLYLLNESLEKVGIGEVGEICVSGPGLAKEYLNCPELTKEKFIDNPFEEGIRLYLSGDLGRYTENGDIEYMGRKDKQVKIRGFRIELGEIESALISHENVNQAVVTAEEKDNKQFLKAYVVIGKEDIKASDLRKYVRRILPDYMVPNVIKKIESIPMNINGKVDYKKLSSLKGDEKVNNKIETNIKQNCNITEKDLVNFFKKELETEEVDPKEDIFNLGATSLSIINCMNWLKEEKNIDIEIDIFLEHPVIEDIAEYIQKMLKVELEAEIKEEKVTYSNEYKVTKKDFSHLLGLLKKEKIDGKTKYLYPSAGGKNSVQTYIYVKAGAIEDVEPGVYYYHPEEHSLYYISKGSSINRNIYPKEYGEMYDKSGFAVFLIAELKAIEPVYLDFSIGLVTIDSGYIKQLLLNAEESKSIGLTSVDAIDFEPIKKEFKLDYSHVVLSGMLGGYGVENLNFKFDDNWSSTEFIKHYNSLPDFITKEGQETLFKNMKYNNLSKREILELAKKKLHIRKFNEGSRKIDLDPVSFETKRYINRSSKRKYLEDKLEIHQILGLLKNLSIQNNERLYPSIGDAYLVNVYVYLKKDAVNDYPEGIYYYNQAEGTLECINKDINDNFEYCHTPFNRPHYKLSKFSIYLVADMNKAKELYSAPYLSYTLSESGTMGQLLMDAQSKNDLGLVPIGGMNFDRIRPLFKLKSNYMLMHSFMGGGYNYNEQPKEKTVKAYNNYNDDIAIVGISGRFPEADNISEFWNNLKNKRNCIIKVPETRWKSNINLQSNYGGFIKDIDQFDSKFFNIAPDEAKYLDPQVRLFLEIVYEALYDTGYSFNDKKEERNIGVYVGSMYQQYHLLGLENENLDVMSIQSYSSIANRTSYYFNLNGPSVAVDTACSSTISALSIAFDNLKNNKCKAAIVGGINLTLHESKYSALNKMGLISKKDKTCCFGDGDGFIPGEGVGAIVLKKKSDAIKDSNHIYGIIKTVNIGHTGRTNAYSMPNVSKEQELIKNTIDMSGLNINDIDFVECAANGTKLGDSAEYTALKNVFANYNKDFLNIGTVKSNIGHLEAASGIAQIIKVLLQFRYNKLLPTININELSPMINTKNSKLSIIKELKDWERENNKEHNVLIDNFASGGTNACLVLSEYIMNKENKPLPSKYTILLTAKDKKDLSNNAAYLVQYLEENEEVNLKDLEYTLCRNRNYQNVRAVIICKDKEDLTKKLQYLAEKVENKEGVLVGFDGDNSLVYRIFKEDEQGKEIVKEWIRKNDISSLAELWIHGVEIDWNDINSISEGNKLFLKMPFFNKKTLWIDKYEAEEKITIETKETEEDKGIKFLSELLKLDAKEIKMTDTLNDIGFNSIYALKIEAYLKEKYKCSLGLRKIMQSENVGELNKLLLQVL